MKVLLDTNFFLIPGKYKVDIFSELTRFGKPELYTLDLVVLELKKLASGRGRDSRHARLALTLLEKKNVRVLATKNKNTDQELERIAAEEDFTVCTQDLILGRRLLREEIRVIVLKGRKVLDYYSL